MTLGDPLQWVIIGFLGLVVVGFVVYLLYRLLRVVDKADKYLDAKMKESKQSNSLARLLFHLTRLG
jgi:hypothetical protein